MEDRRWLKNGPKSRTMGPWALFSLAVPYFIEGEQQPNRSSIPK